MITATVNHATLARWQDQLRDACEKFENRRDPRPGLERLVEEMGYVLAPESTVISCGCCRGPVDDRCCCHNHQDVPAGRPARKCSRHGGAVTTLDSVFVALKGAQSTLQEIHDLARQVSPRDERGAWIAAKASNLFQLMDHWAVLWKGGAR